MGEEHRRQGRRQLVSLGRRGRIEECSERCVEGAVEVPDVNEVGEYGRELVSVQELLRSVQRRDDGSQKVLEGK